MMWALIVAVIEALVRAVVPALANAARPKSSDAARDEALRDRLTARVRSTWGGAAAVLCAVGLAGSLAGCLDNRTVYVAPGTPVRLRETIRQAKVWVLDESGRPVAGKLDLPEGWYVLPDPGPDAPLDGPTVEPSRTAPRVPAKAAPGLYYLQTAPGRETGHQGTVPGPGGRIGGGPGETDLGAGTRLRGGISGGAA